MRNLLLLLAGAVLCLAADSSRYREDFHYSYPQTSGGRLNVENFNGSVEISGWDQNTVEISGTKYAERQDLLSAIRIEASSSGNTVRLKTTRPDRERGSMGAKYIIRVPRRTELENVSSSNGSVRVDELEGNVKLSTSNGSVHLRKIRGNVEARSSNGGVEANEIDGRMAFHTSNGSVHADHVRGAFEAGTSNGGVQVHLQDTEVGYPVKLSSSNGAIDLQLDSSRQNDVSASTSNAPITVRLPAATKASLHAATNSGGSVKSDFEISMHGDLSKHRVDGLIGGGGAKIDLSTSNGNISLLRN